MRTMCVLTVVAVLSACLAHAEPIYQTGFEAGDEPFGDFTPGELPQNGWDNIGYPAGIITNAPDPTPESGNLALFMDHQTIWNTKRKANLLPADHVVTKVAFDYYQDKTFAERHQVNFGALGLELDTQQAQATQQHQGRLKVAKASFGHEIRGGIDTGGSGPTRHLKTNTWYRFEAVYLQPEQDRKFRLNVYEWDKEANNFEQIISQTEGGGGGTFLGRSGLANTNRFDIIVIAIKPHLKDGVGLYLDNVRVEAKKVGQRPKGQ